MNCSQSKVSFANVHKLKNTWSFLVRSQEFATKKFSSPFCKIFQLYSELTNLSPYTKENKEIVRK